MEFGSKKKKKKFVELTRGLKATGTRWDRFMVMQDQTILSFFHRITRKRAVMDFMELFSSPLIPLLLLPQGKNVGSVNSENVKNHR